MKTIIRGMIGLSLLGTPLTANAALILVKGSALVDNTDNNTMWLNDANSFVTFAQASGDPVTFVQTVIATSDGTITDTPNTLDTPSLSGEYALSSLDFDTTSGRMTWWGAKAWVAYLNSINYQGYADWRLPEIVDAPTSHFAIGTAPGFTPPTTGELTQLFYQELGANENGTDFLGSLNTNAAVFVNLQGSYWYATESLYVSANGAWTFALANGPNPKKKGSTGLGAAFPMRSGQASLIDMVTSIQTSAKTAGGKKAEPLNLADAKGSLKGACDSLRAFSKSARRPGNVSSITAQLASDTDALEAVIGCH